ncbi:MAG: cbb3-type cytochrome oxidase assembly protein CcoS [Acidobacteriota bacterium]|nr:MAG: cbb3-type cytochrome oxidase assembly protein CcoS [Acidobacteriota bacterium]
MSVLFIVFPLAILLAVVAVIAFIWAVRTGQYDDTDTPAMRILHDDEPVRSEGDSPTTDRSSQNP